MIKLGLVLGAVWELNNICSISVLSRSNLAKFEARRLDILQIRGLTEIYDKSCGSKMSFYYGGKS